MAKQGYPESLNCWLRDYPRFIKVTFGPEMENLDGPWGNGSVILLEKSDQDTPDTDPVVDDIPPDIKVYYTDNGLTSNWIFQMTMYGWGTFFALTEDDNYYVDLEKWLTFESTEFSGVIKFRLREVVYTQIPKTTSIPNVVVPEDIIYIPPEGEDPPGPVVPPDINDYWNSTAYDLVDYYSVLLNLDADFIVTADATLTNWTAALGRQIGEPSTCAGQQCEFYLFDNNIYIALYGISYDCEDFIVGDPLDCTYTIYFDKAYVFDYINVNGYNRLPELINRV